jgi:hypothetical protein
LSSSVASARLGRVVDHSYREEKSLFGSVGMGAVGAEGGSQDRNPVQNRNATGAFRMVLLDDASDGDRVSILDGHLSAERFETEGD